MGCSHGTSSMGTGSRMNWRHSIEAAKMLAGSHGTTLAPPGRPRQAMLRRAVSAAYYAMFHALCQSNADTLVGQSPPGPHTDLWVETYRALQHRTAKNRLASYIQLTQDAAVRNFGQIFGNMQQQRISADYDPRAKFARSQVITFIGRSEAAIYAFCDAPSPTRRRLAIFLLVPRGRN